MSDPAISCVICVFVQLIDRKRLFSEMTYTVLMGTLNLTHSLAHFLGQPVGRGQARAILTRR